MASLDDVPCIALSLPEVVEEETGFRFAVMDPKKKRSFHTQSFAWALYARPQPRKPLVLRPDVVALRVANLDEKDALLAINEAMIFAKPYYTSKDRLCLDL